jgi:hypothetical protein
VEFLEGHPQNDTTILFSDYLLIIFFTLIFLHIKIPRIIIQGYKVKFEAFTTGSLMEENPTLATTIPAAMVTTYFSLLILKT